MKRALRWVLVGALVLVVAACGAIGGASGKKAASDAAGRDGPPPGGWPQAVDGKLTAAMCGLLTPADYSRYGHNLLPKADDPKPGPNGRTISCLYMTGDALSLTLQPTAEAGKLQFDRDLARHVERLTKEHKASQLAKDVVSGVDQSWFDVATIGGSDEFPEYELVARRGALLVRLNLTVLDKKKAKPAQETLVGLAGLVFQRVPDLGRADLGTTLKVHYEVTGNVKARLLIYSDPNTGKTVDLKDVPLPWTFELPVPSPGAEPIVLQVNATHIPTGNTPGILGCRIAVGDKVVAEQKPSPNLVHCLATYNEQD